MSDKQPRQTRTPKPATTFSIGRITYEKCLCTGPRMVLDIFPGRCTVCHKRVEPEPWPRVK